MNSVKLLINNLIKETNASEALKYTKKLIQENKIAFPPPQKIPHESEMPGNEEKTVLDESIRKEIEEGFEKVVDRMIEDIQNEIDYKPFRLVEEGKQRAKEEIECNFENYNNWISEDDFVDEAGYEKGKKEIINFINQL